ncbi:MAG: glycosyltransferase, partial [Trichormus sp.]
LGGGLESQDLPKLPGNPIVVKYAPQLELLQKASLTVCHAGTNTVLESLFYGVPLVTIPITNDQPGVATRIVWSGVGKFISTSRLTSFRLRQAIEEVLIKPSYKENALRLKMAMDKAGGVRRAIDIIEDVILKS